MSMMLAGLNQGSDLSTYQLVSSSGQYLSARCWCDLVFSSETPNSSHGLE